MAIETDDPEQVHVTYETIAEAIRLLYIGKVIQVYLGEKGGSTHYADFDIDQKIYMEGKVIWSKGNVFALECEAYGQDNAIIKRTILVNAWSVTSVMEVTTKKDNISVFMKGMRR